MDFNTQYLPQALRTESVIAPLTFNKDILDGVVALSIAAGNLADMIKKNAAYDKPINLDAWNANLNDAVKHATDVARANLAEAFPSPALEVNTRIFHGVFGIFTEATELMEAFQKAVAGQEMDYVNLQEEIGDISWYEAILLDEMRANFNDINQRVLNKLKARYPDKFTNENAIQRDLATERAILEGKA